MVEKRQHQLLSLLAKESDYRALQFFADCLDVTERTVRNDIVALNLLSKGRYAVVSKRGIGVRLVKQAELAHQKTIEVKVGTRVDQRRLEIIAHLLILKQRVSINQLAEKYLVSRSSIQNDLKWIRERFPEMAIESNQSGTQFSGSVTALMESLMTFNTYLISQYSVGERSNFKQQKNYLVDYYDVNVVNACYEAVLALIHKDAKLLAEYNAYNTFNVLVSLVNCLLLGLHPETAVEEKFETSRGTAIAVSLLEEISQQVELAYTESDSQLLAKYLISNHMVTLDEDRFNHEIVDRMITKLNEVFKVQVSEDPIFDEQVHQHVTLMLFRLRNEIDYTNPFILDIKEQWSLSFNIIWLVLKEFEEALQVTFSEHEIGFLVVYYQPYIDVSDKSKILVICQHGVAATQLISTKLKNNLPASISIQSTSSLSVTDELLADYDFIVSTVKFETTSPKVIYIDSLIDDRFLEDIRSKMKQPNLDGASLLSELKSLKHFLQEDFIFLNKIFKAKADLLSFADYALTSSGYVTEAFMDSVRQREKQGSTELASGVAIPHGNPAKVKRSVVMVLALDEGLTWSKGQVNLVFLICVEKSDERHLKGVMSDIYSLVTNPIAIEFIHTSQNKQALYRKIGGEKTEEIE